jgi:predicted ATPase
MDRISRVWEMFYPGSRQYFSVEPVGKEPSEGLDVFLNFGGGQRVSLDALSSGQLEIFSLAGSMLPENSSVSLICIDEPELHLDAIWHRVILKAMTILRPQCQFIVATHSQEVADSVYSFQRLFLSPKGFRLSPSEAELPGAEEGGAKW